MEGKHCRLNSGGEPVLISACVHQLGQKKLEFRCQHAATVTVASATCVAFTVFGDEWEEHAWALFRSNLVRQVVKVLQASGVGQPLRAPWGRSFRLGQQPSSANEADSVQFHAQVTSADLPVLLRRSGYNKVYLTPKTWEHTLHPNWSVVWLPGEKEQVSQLAASYPAQFGLARLRKRFGLRVEASAFASAHRALKPSDPLLTAITVKHVFRLSNAPPGLLAAMPLQGSLSMNGYPILIQPQQPKATSDKVVSAGRARPSVAARSDQPDPWIQGDPWSQYLSSKAAPSDSSRAPAPRQTSNLRPHYPQV